MSSRRFCSPPHDFPFIILLAALMGFSLPGLSKKAIAGDAPPWMQVLVNAQLPEYDEKTDAILLYSEHIVTVDSETKIKAVVRKAYKILRADGRDPVALRHERGLDDGHYGVSEVRQAGLLRSDQ